MLTSANSRDRVHRFTEERGAILPLMAIILVVLMGTAAMAVDLGYLYWRSLEIQQAADAAALAGVIYEPDQRTEAHTEGLSAAVQNGFVHDPANGNSIEIIDFFDDPSAVNHSAQLRATITQRVPTFFLKALGLDTVDISRSALAEYVRPLALGSPEAAFGADPETGYDPGLWASVQGSYGPTSWGDRYTALCIGGSYGDPSCPPNPEGRPSLNEGTASATGGYLYGIEVAEGASGLTVEIFDGPFYDGNSPMDWTGDYGPSSPNPMGTTFFMLYGPDPTPADTTDGNELLCVIEYGPRNGRADDYAWWDPAWTSFSDLSVAQLSQMWDDMQSSADQTMCAADFERGSGIYPLRVMVEHEDNMWTTNKYSLRTSTASGAPPMVYGLGDMSIYANFDLGSSVFYLARVEEIHAGKTLIVEFWDAGDVDVGGVDDTLTISSGNGTPPSCTWEATNGDSGSTCTVNVSAKRYNGHLVTVTIPIPDDYTCSGNGCWFRATYDYTGTEVHDTTSWTAYITGNPIRIVE